MVCSWRRRGREQDEQVRREESVGAKTVSGPRQVVVVLERKGAAEANLLKPRVERMGPKRWTG